MLARVRISSPQIRGEVDVKVKGEPKLILVNGHWNRLLNIFNAAPGEGGIGYWSFFLGANLNGFIQAAWKYFKEPMPEIDTLYVDGSSLFGGDQSGGKRKQLGYRYALKHFTQIVEGVGTEKIYLISHSEGCAYAAGIAKALIEKGYKVGESIMLAADEGDEFSVEGNYPAYQITAGILRTQSKLFEIDWIVGNNPIKGISKSGVYIADNVTTMNVHTAPISASIFNKLIELKTLRPQLWLDGNGQAFYRLPLGDSTIWHRVDDTIVYKENKP